MEERTGFLCRGSAWGAPVREVGKEETRGDCQGHGFPRAGGHDDNAQWRSSCFDGESSGKDGTGTLVRASVAR